MSFYYWRTVFSLDSVERAALQRNRVDTLYVRYFDVDRGPAPVAPIRFADTVGRLVVVPVVYLRNRVFEADTTALVENVRALVARIDAQGGIRTAVIQFDCDWTEKTKDRYFGFLRGYARATGAVVSCTVRLHQVKYPERSGVPPVDHGVLMFYNMGTIDAGNGSSIYDARITQRYIASLHTYPLPMDVALPVFAWGLQVRDGRVIGPLNKMDSSSFEGDTNFVRVREGRYRAVHSCFKDGYYFQASDEAKTECVSAADLLNIVRSVNRYSNRRIRNLIFFDLNRHNLVQYDNDIFQEILAHTD